MSIYSNPQILHDELFLYAEHKSDIKILQLCNQLQDKEQHSAEKTISHERYWKKMSEIMFEYYYI